MSSVLQQIFTFSKQVDLLLFGYPTVETLIAIHGRVNV